MSCCGTTHNYGQPVQQRLRWAPPAQTNPTIVYVGDSSFNNSATPFASDEDYILLLPTETKRTSAGLAVYGGRHGRIIGGNMGPGRLIVGDVTGSFFIEGVRWEMTSARDCIGFYGKPGATPDWYFQNLYFGGVQGSFDGTHADMIQIYDLGPVGGDIHIHNVTGDTTYQGFKIDVYQAVEPAGRCYISNVNLKGSAGAPILYFLRNNDDAADGMYPMPTELDEVYAEPASGQDLQSTAWPTVGQTIGGVDAGNYLNADGSLSFPAFVEIAGSIKPGQPAGGDFCASTAGVGYRSPGYR